MKKCRLNRYLSMILVWVLLVNMYPIQSRASINSGDAQAGLTDRAGEVETAESVGGRSMVSVMYEVEEFREEDKKHFRLSDGSFLAVAYGMPIHYQDEEGKWQDIDNSFVMSADDTGVSTFQNVSGNNIVSFAATLGNGEIFTATYEDMSVSMSLLDTAQADLMSEASLVANNVPFMYTLEEERSWKVEDVIPGNLQSSLLYEEVFPGIDLMYTAYSYNIKEQIIVNERQESYCYDFLLKLDGLTALLNDDGSISLMDGEGVKVYEIPRPFMEDSDGEISMAVSYVLTTSEQGTVLTLEADKEWINSGERVMPVRIDPTIIFQPEAAQTDLYTNYVRESMPGSSFHYNADLYIGIRPNETVEDRSRIFMHVANTPDIPAGCEIVDARLHLYVYKYVGQNCGQFPIGLYEVTSEKPSMYADSLDWFSELTWYTQPVYDSANVIDYAMAKSGEEGYLEWDMSELVKKWYLEGKENTNIALVMMNEEQVYGNNGSAYASIRAFGAGYPIYTIAYRNTVGIEPYYTYAALDAGNAGTGYLADHTGQFKIVREVASYASTVNPFSLSLVYNSDYFASSSDDVQPPQKNGLGMRLGSGWTMDVIQTIGPEGVMKLDYLRYMDGDGTIHYFLKNEEDGLYYDEDGLGLKIKKIDDLTYEMTDKEDNLWIFNNGILKTIMDNDRTKNGDTLEKDGNRIVIQYNASNQITSIEQKNKDGTIITVASFLYDTEGYLTSITDAAGQVTSLGYTGSDLTSINRHGYHVAEYSYAGHCVTQMKDTNQGYALNLEHTGGRVSGYYETGEGNRGAECRITYPDAGKTVYHDYGVDGLAGSDDIYTYCLFDHEGRTVNMYSTETPVPASGELTTGVLSAANAVYTVQGAVDYQEDDLSKSFNKNNRISRSSDMGIASQQLMQDFGFEAGLENTGWTLSGLSSEGNGTNITINGDKPRTGNYSLKGWIGENNSNSAGVSAVRPTKTLKAGETYTFSAYVNTSQITQVKGKGIYLQALNGIALIGESNPVDYTTAAEVNGGWVRLSVTFTAETDGEHLLRIYNDRAEGVFFMDDLQLEKGQAPSNVNLLENGDMRTVGQGWTVVSGGTYVLGGLKLSGDPLKDDIQFYQDVPLNLPGEESYILSGWVRANAVPDNKATGDTEEEKQAYAKDTEKKCGLRATINYTDNTTEYHYVAFDADVTEWQFVSMAVVPKETSKTVASIRVTGTYERNANDACFDNLSLVRESAQTFTYDEEGNLVSVTSTGLKQETNTYENGNLMRTITGGNGTYKYDYDTTYTHRLIRVTAEGVGLNQSYGYDTVGNITSTTLQGSTEGQRKIQISATYEGGGNRLAGSTDSIGSTTTYTYGDALSKKYGVPTITTDANGDQVRQTLDTFGRLIDTKVYEAGNSESINAVTYSYYKFRLQEIGRSSRSDTSQPGTTQYYRFGYDDYGNSASVQVGDRTLATYTYGPRNGPLQTMTYGNGDSIGYTYDKYGRVSKETRESGSLTYTYNGEGLLHSIREDKGDDKPTLYNYTYDSLDRLLYIERLNNGVMAHRIANEYNDKNQLASRGVQLNGISYVQDFTYWNGDGSLTKMTIDLPGTSGVDHTINLGYDHLRRLAWVSNDLFTSSYTYQDVEGSTDLTTTRVKSLWYSAGAGGGLAFHYTYNPVGNISTYQEPSGITTYEYDAQGQLTKAVKGNTTYAYTYDSVGNILTATRGNTTHSYTYGDTNWKDLLTAYDDQVITYDGVGNPLQYYNGRSWTFTWTDGRKLSSAVTGDGGTSVSYTYGVDGTRYDKTVNGVTHYYIWADGKPLKEYVAGNTDVYDAGDTLFFFYDQNGRPYAMQYNGSTYYYVLNLQGDVIWLVDEEGTQVASYEYDPYGNIISATGTMAQINPLRYRGYYYESETGLYYLNGRYYDPAVGRFISADGEISGVGGDVIGYNMYSYCFNNPVNMSDPDGNWPKWVKNAVAAVAVVAVVAVAAAVTVATAGVGSAAACVAIGALQGAIIGAVTGAVSGAVTSAVEHRVSTGSWSGSGAAARDGAASGALSGAITGAVTGGVSNKVNNVCFVAGTSVLTSIGYVSIENISVGDKVWSENPETGEKELKEVVQTFVNKTDELVHVHVNGEEIKATPEHPFYVPQKGWTGALDLRAGDILVLQSGEYVIVELVQHEILEAPITVYNFEVADFHTYYVSDSAIWVHNTCGVKSVLPKNGQRINSSDALDLADDFLGTGYSEMSPGRFVSADGLRQVRMTMSDLTVINNHAGAPHLNFETLVPNPLKPGKFMITGNSHIFIFD